LVRLFVDSGMDIKKIFVRQTHKNCESYMPELHIFRL
jgi:hypothetical protein